MSNSCYYSKDYKACNICGYYAYKDDKSYCSCPNNTSGEEDFKIRKLVLIFPQWLSSTMMMVMKIEFVSVVNTISGMVCMVKHHVLVPVLNREVYFKMHGFVPIILITINIDTMIDSI